MRVVTSNHTSVGKRVARLIVGGRTIDYEGEWIAGTPWQRFGLYNAYIVVRSDGSVLKLPAHAGELVPGSTEDLIAFLDRSALRREVPSAPLTVELDPTYACSSGDCGGRCFSAAYRRMAPRASIATPLLRGIIRTFAGAGGRILRFDGGGDPLMHEAVRNGELLELAAQQNLKTTILTSGDLLFRTNLEKNRRVWLLSSRLVERGNRGDAATISPKSRQPANDSQFDWSVYRIVRSKENSGSGGCYLFA